MHGPLSTHMSELVVASNPVMGAVIPCSILLIDCLTHKSVDILSDTSFIHQMHSTPPLLEVLVLIAGMLMECL